MPETIQVIRVERVASGDIDDGDFIAGDGEDFKVYQVVGDVIELTEALTFGTNDDSIDRPRFRLWVEPLEPVDD